MRGVGYEEEVESYVGAEGEVAEVVLGGLKECGVTRWGGEVLWELGFVFGEGFFDEGVVEAGVFVLEDCYLAVDRVAVLPDWFVLRLYFVHYAAAIG